MRGLDADSVLGGRYRLIAPVAEGGMGEVWEARDELLDRVVAVKVLKPEFAADAGFLDRFRTEARNSARLSHPNIATLYDYGEDEGRAYLVMELVPGAPLSDLIAADAPLDVTVAAAITAQTARGLAAAHRAGLVHRDVKPGNLLVTPDGSVKITDFGISRATSQSPVTATGEVMGTASYLAPEQAIGRRDIGPATDLYALGVVLHEMLSGVRPFTGDSQVAIALAQVNQPPPPLPASVSDAADALVAALLVKEPERRPSDAAGVAAVADRLAAGDDAGALTRLRGIVPAAAAGAAAGAAGAAGATAASTTVMPAGESTTRAMPPAVGGGVDPTAVVAAPPAATGAMTGTPLRGAGVGDREPAGGVGRPPRRLTTPLIGLIVVLAIILLAAIVGIFNGLGDADGPVTDPVTDQSTEAPQDDPAPSEETPKAPPTPEPDKTTPSSSTTSAPVPSDDEDAPSGDTRPTQPAPATTTPKTTPPPTTTSAPPATPPAEPDPPAEPGGDAPGAAADGAADGAGGGG